MAGVCVCGGWAWDRARARTGGGHGTELYTKEVDSYEYEQHGRLGFCIECLEFRVNGDTFSV